MSHELPPRSLRFPIPPPSGTGILLAVGVPPPNHFTCVVSFPQLRTGLTQYFIAEGIRSYTLGICGVVSAVPVGANPPVLRVHFVPLRRFLAFMQIAADSQQTFRFRAGYRVWGGRTGRSPCLTAKSEGLSVASIAFQALKALNSTCTFQIAPLEGAFTGLSYQRGLRLPGRYPMSPTRSPDGSGTLVPSRRGLPHGRR